jgi:hypothetical protein
MPQVSITHEAGIERKTNTTMNTMERTPMERFETP